MSQTAKKERELPEKMQLQIAPWVVYGEPEDERPTHLLNKRTLFASYSEKHVNSTRISYGVPRTIFISSDHVLLRAFPETNFLRALFVFAYYFFSLAPHVTGTLSVKCFCTFQF